MTADHWQRVEELYHAAAALPPAERRRFLDDACGDDAALRAEVESLLAYDAPAAAFIEAPALDVAARLMADDWSATNDSLAGTSIGQFRVTAKLGEGGMGVVYEAEDTRLQRHVALKFLRPMTASAPALERFEREARAASALNHPNICTIYGVEDHGGQPIIEMERLDGETLRDRIARGPLDVQETVALALQMTDALDAAHAKGIVHCDLTPGNVFRTARGAAKILDFGIATLESTEERDGAILGTAGYMSPEQALGHAVDARTDLFSLGAVLYAMATGASAFPASSPSSVRRAILDDEPVPPRQLNRKVPVALERIILKALRKDRELRYQSAAEMRADLERLQPHANRRRQQLLIAGLAVAMLLLAATVLWYVRQQAGDPFGNVRVRRITHNASEYSVRSGSLSRDGRYVAYADPGGIHLLTLATGETRDVPGTADLPHGRSWDLSPGWMPDSSAFVANQLSGEGMPGMSVWITGTSGSPRKLRDDAAALTVSPDGASIAFSAVGSERGLHDVWIMSADGQQARKLFDAPAGTAIAQVVWSPDARRLAYLRTNAGGVPMAIELRDLAGGAPSTILDAPDQQVLQGMVWLHAERLLYSLRRIETTTSAGIVPCTHWELPLDPVTARPRGASRRTAGWLPQCVGPLQFTADGKRAAYVQGAVQDAIHVADVDAAMATATAVRRFTFAEGRNIPSGWTSDNRSIVFVSDWRGQPALVRQAIDSATPEPILAEPGIIGAARLTPDGTAIVYLAGASRRSSLSPQKLMLVPVAGGASREIVAGRFIDGGARCTLPPADLCAFAERSSDGRQLVFTALRIPEGRGRELARFDVTPNGDYRWALSPEGTRIAVVDANAARISIVSLSGARSETIDVRGHGTLGYVSWTSDGQRLLVPGLTGREAALLSIDLRGAVSVVWRHAGAIDISGIASPDGRRIAIWVRSRHANIWLAETQ